MTIMKQHRLHRNGMTLIELLIVVAIIAVTSGVLWSTMIIYGRNTHIFSYQSDVQNAARMTCYSIIKDIANTSDILQEYEQWQRDDSTLILQYKSQDRVVVYQKVDDALYRYSITDAGTAPHKTAVITDNVTTFTYTIEGKRVRFRSDITYTWQDREKTYTYSSAGRLQ